MKKSLTIFALLVISIQSFSHNRFAANDTILSNFYFSKADSLSEAALYDSAVFFYQKASKIYEKIQDWDMYVTCFQQIGWNLMLKGAFNAAIIQLTIDLKNYGKEHPAVARHYNNMGNVYKQTGVYDRAAVLHQKALNIRLKILDKEHYDIATSYTNIGSIYSAKKDYTKAMSYQNKALTVFKNVFGNYHPHVGLVHKNIAANYKEQNILDTALYFYQKAIQSLVLDFYNSSIYVNPILANINSKVELLDTLTSKAEVFENKWKLNNE